MKKILLIIFGLFLISCDNSEEYDKIAGEWNCTQWITESTGENMCSDNVYFNFKRDNTYVSKIGSLEETGIYKYQTDLCTLLLLGN